MITIKNIGFCYPDGHRALNHVSIDIQKGTNVAVVGANGAGKSTLLALIVGLHNLMEGKIEIDGTAVGKGTLVEIRKKVGFVFQNPDDQLFMARVYDDISFGPRNFGYPPEKITVMADTALEIMKIGHLKDRAPHKLSGGEKRNVAIAAVLAMNPEVLLLDEPSSYLDPKSRRNFILAMEKLPHTKLIATHDLDLVLDLCDRVIIMSRGEIIADGAPMELFLDDKLMDRSGLELPLSLQIRK